MAAVLEFLKVLAGLILGNTAIMNQILGIVDHTAQEEAPLQIATDVANIIKVVDNPEYGNHELLERINLLSTQLADDANALSAAIANISGNGSTPPSWYTPPTNPPSTDDVASAVWGYQGSSYRINLSQFGLSMQQQLEGLWQHMALELGFEGTPLPARPWFTLCTAYPDGIITGGYDWSSTGSVFDPAEPDWSAWAADDTPYSFLARTQPAFGWTLTGPGGANDGRTAWKAQGDPGPFRNWLRSNFSELDVGTYQGARRTYPTPPPVVVPNPPVVSDPTKHPVRQAAISWDSAFLHSVPCDGLTYTCSEFARRVKSYHVDSYNVYLSAGVCAFLDSSGNAEPFQWISSNQGVLTPRTMARASGFIWSSQPGLNGTVTPFDMVPN